jgi:deoxyribonuclease V
MHVPPPPHSWSVTPQEAVALQKRMSASVSRLRPDKPIRLVAGLDAAFSADESYCLAAVVVWDVDAQRVVEEKTGQCRLAFPYIPGLLSFREAPALVSALRKLEQTPDVLMCDGQGLAHPRRFGIACHLGVICDLPAIGCAKSRLVGAHDEPGRARGSSVPLRDGQEVIGAVLRTQDGIKPVYVSIGHKMDLAAAERIVLACAVRHRLPEPTRLADRLVAVSKKQWKPPICACSRA